MNTNNLVGLRKYTIRELEPFVQNSMILVIIISKQRPKKITYRNGDGVERAVWNFTVRDSPTDYVNVAFWGGVDSTFALSEKFQIGDVVEIQKANIQIRKIDDYGEQFRPMVTSPFQLTLNENECQIILMTDGRFEELRRVLHLPTKPITNYISIADLHSNINALTGQCVDLLVAVRSIGEIRNVRTRTGESQVRSVVVFDQTHPGLTISLWDAEYIARASLWKPRLTILFMADMKVSYDNYTQGSKANFSMRTIVTEDPNCTEAVNLRNFARSAALEPSAILDQMACLIPDPSTIKTVMNIRQIQSKILQIADHGTRPEDKQFTALVYGVVTQLDIDGFTRIFTTRCTRCKSIVTSESGKCELEACMVGNEHAEVETSFDLRLTISDHTGSLSMCKLNGRYAESVLNCSVDSFLAMPDEEKSQVKWKFLTERCEMRIMVLCMKANYPITTILGCSLVNQSDLFNKL